MEKRDASTRKTEQKRRGIRPPRGDSDIFSSSNSRHKFLHYADGSRMLPRAIVPLAGKQTLKRRSDYALSMMQLRFRWNGEFHRSLSASMRLLRWARLNNQSSFSPRSRLGSRMLLSRRSSFFLPFFLSSPRRTVSHRTRCEREISA